jgi:pyridoxal phosphate enzyme (YggS family)
MSDVAKNLSAVNTAIHASELAAGRAPGSVTLLAISKRQSIAAIEAAYAAGQKYFGENYLQEALPKIAALVAADIEWHFVGPIQSNKIKKIAANFHWVQSVEDFFTAERLSQQRPDHLSPLNICLQVNICHEKNKSGITPDALLPLALQCVTLPKIKLRGLMCIPSPTKIFLEQREIFHKVQELFKNLNQAGLVLDTLSMGMSEDLGAAIAEGATMVRIGTKIFGQRR